MKPSITKARELRKNSTDAERFLWQHLRLRQIDGERFRRQRPVGPYILDFVCLERKVAIEVDGGQHNEVVSRDRQRDEWLRKQGFVVLRFWNHEVLTQIDVAKEAIWKALNETPSFVLPARGGGNKCSLYVHDSCAIAITTWSFVANEPHLKPHRGRRQLGSGQ